MFPFWTIPNQRPRKLLPVPIQNNTSGGIGGNGNDIITINGSSSQGPPGPQGPQGLQGPPGPSGAPANNNIATSNTLGDIIVGSGLSITTNGVLSTTIAPGGVSVKLVSKDYDVLPTDYYIGVTRADEQNNVTIKLPLGTSGKFYIIKNQAQNGVITVTGFAGEKIDTSVFKTLGSESSLMVIFDGTRWNVIQ